MPFMVPNSSNVSENLSVGNLSCEQELHMSVYKLWFHNHFFFYQVYHENQKLNCNTEKRVRKSRITFGMNLLKAKLQNQKLLF